MFCHNNHRWNLLSQVFSQNITTFPSPATCTVCTVGYKCHRNFNRCISHSTILVSMFLLIWNGCDTGACVADVCWKRNVQAGSHISWRLYCICMHWRIGSHPTSSYLVWASVNQVVTISPIIKEIDELKSPFQFYFNPFTFSHVVSLSVLWQLLLLITYNYFQTPFRSFLYTRHYLLSRFFGIIWSNILRKLFKYLDFRLRRKMLAFAGTNSSDGASNMWNNRDWWLWSIRRHCQHLWTSRCLASWWRMCLSVT